MSNQWLRALQSTALKARARGHSIRPVPLRTRCFHTTVPSRSPAPDDTSNDSNSKSSSAGNSSTAKGTVTGGGNGSNSTPQAQDSKDPENASGKSGDEGRGGEQPAVTEKPVGEDGTQTNTNTDTGTSTSTNGETQGRKKPVNGIGPRARAQRNRQNDLPPVQIPPTFLERAIDRHGDIDNAIALDAMTLWPESNQDGAEPSLSRSVMRGLATLFEPACWTGASVEEAIKALAASPPDVGPITRRLDLLGITVDFAVLQEIEKVSGGEKVESMAVPPNLPPWLVWLLFRLPIINEWDGEMKRRWLQDRVSATLEHAPDLPANPPFEPCMVDEIVGAVRAELMIRAPEGSRAANIRRLATIINVHECSGFIGARDTLRHVAGKLEADILHLQAHDIAYIVGRYVGQDATRSPGDISLLGYRAAEYCGRLKPPPAPAEEENGDSMTGETPIAVLVHEDRDRKDTKRQTASISDFLVGPSSRERNEELWEDMKVTAALEELIHSAGTNTDPQKALIVHVHDYNALAMDGTGAAILGKIRRIIDELWLSKRRIVLVGSCSAGDAPKPYRDALKSLEMSERVIHLHKGYHPSHVDYQLYKKTLKVWEELSNLRENDENITRMLWTMTELSPRKLPPALGLVTYAVYRDTRHRQQPKYRCNVLPVTEIYRIATTMVSLGRTDNIHMFDEDRFARALVKIEAADIAREKAETRLKEPSDSKRSAKGDGAQGRRMLNPFAENHEEKLLSGMINAKDIRTTFKDIHAPQETIDSIKMLTTLSLVRPEAFSYGVLANDRIPGCLLYGPPGTGKTLLAKAVAKESGANMIEVSGASINNMWIGESEKNVRALFRLAKKKEPMVIFIDEADALFAARSEVRGGTKRETLNQFLREWDGMDKSKAFIMVATNRPYDLDEAVLRRLPRKLLIDLPLEKDRAAILGIHLRDEILDETVSTEALAKLTPLYSGSDLKNVCVAAAMAAVKEELDASERHTGPDPFQWAEKRVLNRRHFDHALKEIGASVSGDMAMLTAIRKFDERYGDANARKKRKGMGFEVVPELPDANEARVRRWG
ncbi:hypothetical protein F4777DRAFT_538812 [Nemania sp. FL0916]|nr:hypothetical protein F4777DRAFT_538812 [Nemania sp. FL0916]